VIAVAIHCSPLAALPTLCVATSMYLDGERNSRGNAFQHSPSNSNADDRRKFVLISNFVYEDVERSAPVPAACMMFGLIPSESLRRAAL
jgi:hypothetical protein